MTPKLIIFCAPSGSGKTTIVRHLINLERFKLAFSVSATTRSPRKGEEDGVHYYFLSLKDFKNRIEKGEFIEYEEVYKDTFYGTLRSEIDRLRNEGFHVIFDIDVQGGMRLKELYPDDSLSVFVKVPSEEELEKRLERRKTETDKQLRDRLEKAKHESTYAKEFDTLLVNDKLEVTLAEAEKMMIDFLE